MQIYICKLVIYCFFYILKYIVSIIMDMIMSVFIVYVTVCCSIV